MKVELLLKKITNNWFAKCLCIAAAIILYLFGLTSRLEKRTFTVPLEVKDDGELLKTSSINSTVFVTVRTDSKNMPNFSNTDIKAVLDLSYYVKEGTYSVPVTLNLSSEIAMSDPVELIVSPEFISVTLEKKIRKNIPIVVPTAGDPLHGYELKDIKVNPEYAVILGPRSVIENVKQISTDELVLTEKKEAFNSIQNVKTFNKHVQILSPSKVNVSVELQVSLAKKQFNAQPIFFASLDPKFEVVSNTDVNFTVSGAQLIVEKYYPTDYTVQVDCSKIDKPGEYELPVVISVQDAIKIVEQNVQVVKIQVKEKKIEQNLGEQ